jgi:hypothetical protein
VVFCDGCVLFCQLLTLFASVNVFNKYDMFIVAQGVNEASNAVQRVSIFDNDEFDIMTQDQVDTSRIHKGKR